MTHRTQPWQRFQNRARRHLSRRFHTTLAVRDVSMTGGLKHSFDMVSPRFATVGDAKYLTNIKTPAAKYSDIAEYVWLLQNTKARTRFIVFGENRTLAQRWLNRYAPLVKGVQFYFLRGSALTTLRPTRRSAPSAPRHQAGARP